MVIKYVPVVVGIEIATVFQPGTVLSGVKYQQEVAELQPCRGGLGEAGVRIGISKSELNKIRPAGCANIGIAAKSNKKQIDISFLF